MTGERPQTHPLVVSKRDQVIDSLTEYFASDALTLEDFEARLDQANQATSLDELSSILNDLEGPHARRRAATTPTRYAGPRKSRGLVLGFWGGSTRSGAWTPAQRNFVVAFQGGVELDLREARLPPGGTDFTVFCAMGGVNIIVPPGLAVDFGGIGVMGAFEHEPGPPAETNPDSPYVRINGLAVWGGANIEVRLPGETSSDAKQRRRIEKRVQKALPKSRATEKNG